MRGRGWIGWTVAGTLAVWILATSAPVPPRVAYLRASQALAPHQCESLTREGRRCRNPVKYGDGPLCHVHRAKTNKDRAGWSRL